MRFPVAAKIALHSAGANGGTPGSPTPLAGTSIGCSTICTRVSFGDSSIRAIGASLKLPCSTRPSLKLISPYLSSASEPHDGRALDLRPPPLGIDAEAAVDRGVDARHRDVALGVHLDLDHGRDVADERAMRRDAEGPALRQVPGPDG